ncbi:hypothetical protein BRD13_04810 [Halobacteriales archaeon SW_5_70_135]|nr:MAG: hypothetical protein BRD13_04810 [Halobacteriales archaeon SW_5_70_135]
MTGKSDVAATTRDGETDGTGPRDGRVEERRGDGARRVVGDRTAGRRRRRAVRTVRDYRIG